MDAVNYNQKVCQKAIRCWTVKYALNLLDPSAVMCALPAVIEAMTGNWSKETSLGWFRMDESSPLGMCCLLR